MVKGKVSLGILYSAKIGKTGCLDLKLRYTPSSAMSIPSFASKLCLFIFYQIIHVACCSCVPYLRSQHKQEVCCQSCEMSRIWRIYPCKNIDRLGWKFMTVLFRVYKRFDILQLCLLHCTSWFIGCCTWGIRTTDSVATGKRCSKTVFITYL